MGRAFVYSSTVCCIRGRSTGFLPPYARTRELLPLFSSIFLFGQSDFQVSKTIFDSREILFLEACYFFGASTFWSSCWVLAHGGGSSVRRPLLYSSVWDAILSKTYQLQCGKLKHKNTAITLFQIYNTMPQEMQVALTPDLLAFIFTFPSL